MGAWEDRPAPYPKAPAGFRLEGWRMPWTVVFPVQGREEAEVPAPIHALPGVPVVLPPVQELPSRCVKWKPCLWLCLWFCLSAIPGLNWRSANRGSDCGSPQGAFGEFWWTRLPRHPFPGPVSPQSFPPRPCPGILHAAHRPVGADCARNRAWSEEVPSVLRLDNPVSENHRFESHLLEEQRSGNRLWANHWREGGARP
jgi:hypothetical protein